ncbi:MAG: hypothetical protein HRT36_02685 [Alphaproteobacteria bacterium]|nr:hypothetical protein [Alphaproteobacteria bacterium]
MEDEQAVAGSDSGDTLYQTIEDAARALAKAELPPEEQTTEDEDGTEQETVKDDPETSEDNQSDDEDGSDDAEDKDQDVETDEGDSEDESDVVATLADGTELTQDELENRVMMQADYTRKTQQLAEDRKVLETERTDTQEMLQQSQTAFQNIVSYVESILPPDPDVALAGTNAEAYTYQKALREAALNELQNVMGAGAPLQEAGQAFTDQDFKRVQESEKTKLLEQMPELKDPPKRAAFDANVLSTGQDFGFTKEEIAGTVDSRLLLMTHYARLGKIAEKNRNNAKKSSIKKPIPLKGRAANHAASTRKPSDAKKRFNQDSSIANATALLLETEASP